MRARPFEGKQRGGIIIGCPPDGADVIITDINMPVMDGIAFIKACRANTTYAATPILTLTTESSAEKKAEGRAAGATGWIVKPFNPEGLIRVVEKVCP